MLRIKSVTTPAARTDGLRILATRFRGRGLPKDRYDVWMPSLGPSESLLRRVLAEEIPWRRFAKLYRDELFAPGAVDVENRTIKNHGQKFTLRLIKHLAAKGAVTLLCHCPEEKEHCHLHVLRELLTGSRI